MLGDRFNRLFADLTTRWEAWWRAPRDPDRVPELASARFALEDARAAISVERVRLVVPSFDIAARTSVSAEDRARLAVRAAGYQQN